MAILSILIPEQEFVISIVKMDNLMSNASANVDVDMDMYHGFEI
jgi:hypothetical protein